MKAVAFSLQKGGVSKTSLSGSLAFELARRGKVVLVDCDAQGNLSSWLVKGNPPFELADVLTGKCDIQEAIAETPYKGLGIIPTFGLGGGLRPYSENQLSNEPFIVDDLRQALEGLGYDFAVFDLSPAFGKLERAVLFACQEVITPMSPEYFGLDGIAIFEAELARLRKNMRKGPDFARIAITMFDARISQHQEIVAQARETLKGYDLFLFPVDPVFRKAQAEHKFIQQLTGSQAAKAESLAELQRLTEELWP